MTSMQRQRSRRLTLFFAALIAAVPAGAQTPTPPSPPATPEPAAEARPTGLAPGVDWTFNFDAGWGTFGFGNSYFTNPKGDIPENLSDQWFEGYIKPALS